MSNMKVYVMENGMNHNYPKNNMVSWEDKSEMISFQSYTVLIKHKDGNILFDAATHNEPDRQAPFILDSLDLKEEDRPVNRLAQIGVTPDEIKYIVLSHMHPDHYGFIEKFPNAEILVSDDEFTNIMKDYALNRFPFVKDMEYFIKLKLNWKLLPNDQKTVKLMDGVTIYSFGKGHSYGMIGLLLELPESGNKLLVSDAIYTAENVGPPVRLPGVIADKDAWLSSMDYILKLAEELKAEIWYGHDLNQFKGMLKSTEGWYE